MLPDIEIVVAAHLRATTAVMLLTQRIGTRTPPDVAGQFVKVTLIDDEQAPNSPALHLVSALVQIDCYGSSNRDSAHAEASLLARTVREAIVAMPQATHTGCVVTAARTSSRRLTDTDLDPARERYIVTCDLTLHS